MFSIYSTIKKNIRCVKFTDTLKNYGCKTNNSLLMPKEVLMSRPELIQSDSQEKDTNGQEINKNV